MTKHRSPPPDITPQIVKSASACLHSWHLECHGDPRRRRPPPATGRPGTLDEESRRIRLLQWLPGLIRPEGNGRDPRRLGESTRILMKEGRPWIAEAVLTRPGMSGTVDLLKREPNRSALGLHSYSPILLRPGLRGVDSRTLWELGMMGHLLEPHLGRRPRYGWIYRGGAEEGAGAMTQVDLARPWPDFQLLLSDLERIRDGTLQTEGLRHRGCDRCSWFSHCRSVWKETSQLSLLPGVQANWIPRLRNIGVPTWTKAAETDPDRLARSGGLGREEATDLWLHARAWTRRRPVLRRTAHFPTDRPIYFVDPGVLDVTCTVLACLRFHRGTIEHREFVARQATPGHERAIWDAFLAAIAKDATAAAFPWSRVEQRILAGLWHRYRGDPGAWKAFQTSPSTLQGFVREHFALPVSAYDLGETARLFGERSLLRDPEPADTTGGYEAWTRSRHPEELTRLIRGHRARLSAMRSIYFGLQMFQETGLAAPA